MFALNAFLLATGGGLLSQQQASRGLVLAPPTALAPPLPLPSVLHPSGFIPAFYSDQFEGSVCEAFANK